MATIQYAFSSVTTEQSTTSTSYVSTTCSIASSSLTAGDKYLVWATAQVRTSSSSSSRLAYMRVVAGSTEIGASEYYSPQNFELNRRRPYQWFHVWTAGSGEALTVQFRSSNADTTVSADQITLFAINLSDDLVENTDWFFNELTTDSSSLTTTWVDGATMTFTPGTGSQQWLVASLSQLNVDGGGSAVRSRLTRSGEGSTPQPSQSVFPYDFTGHRDQQLNVIALTLGAASNTFTEQSSSSGSNSHTRLNSKVFALRLAAFGSGSGATYTDGDGSALTDTAWAVTPQTHSITPASGPVWIGASMILSSSSSQRSHIARLQVANSDSPATQTSDAYVMDRSAGAGECGWCMQTVESLSSTTAIDVDAYYPSSDQGSIPRNRLIWALALEIGGGGGGGSTGANKRGLMGIF